MKKNVLYLSIPLLLAITSCGVDNSGILSISSKSQSSVSSVSSISQDTSTSLVSSSSTSSSSISSSVSSSSSSSTTSSSSSSSSSSSTSSSSSSSSSTSDPGPAPKELGYGNWTTRKNIDKSNTVTISKASLRNKVLGAWVGNAIGLGSGFEYVHGDGLNATTPYDTKTRVAFGDEYFETDGYLCCGSVGENRNKSRCYIYSGSDYLCDPRVYQGKIVSDDDMHVDVMMQYLLRDEGPFLDAFDVMNAWSSNGYGIHDAGGGLDARRIANDLQYVAPYIGQQLYGNSQWFVTEPWIENDMIGVDFPYMTRSCDTMAAFTGSVCGDGYAVYLGRLCALFTSLAYEYNDAKQIMEKAFDYMDKNNAIYEMYQFVKAEYEKKTSWRDTCVKVADHRTWTHNRPETQYGDMTSGGYSADFSIVANAGMIFTGLFYGENDFLNSVKITSLCGLDGDCTAATVGQILGVMVGFDVFPQRYKNYLNGDSCFYNYSGSSANKEEYNPGWDWPFAYCDDRLPYKTTINQLVDITMGNIEQEILAFGGSIDGDEYTIVKQDLPVSNYIPVTNYSFEKGDTTGWTNDGGSFSCDDSCSNFRVVESTHSNPDYKHSGKLVGTGKAYQNLTLIPNHEYKVSMYVQRRCDKEFRLFANENYTSYVRTTEFPEYCIGQYEPYWEDNFNHFEFTFKANTADYKIGIELVNGGTVNFDDLEISDITNYTETYYQGFDINYFYGNTGTTKSGNNAHLTNGSSLKFEFYGYNGLQNFKFFASNTTNALEDLTLYIDNVYYGKLPIQVNGTVDFTKVASRDAILYAGPGKHIMKVTLSKGSSLDINHIEVVGTNYNCDR